MNDYLAALLFFLPAGIANMTPPMVNKIPWLNRWTTPMDFSKSWQGQRILGDHKTWRGLVTGTLAGGLTAIIVAKLNANTVVTILPFWAGCLLGFGALAGDAAKSFFKRRCGLSPGQSWFPLDQIDYIFGGLILIYPFVHLPIWVMTTVIVAYFGLHLLVSYGGYLLGFKDKPI